MKAKMPGCLTLGLFGPRTFYKRLGQDGVEDFMNNVYSDTTGYGASTGRKTLEGILKRTRNYAELERIYPEMDLSLPTCARVKQELQKML